MSTDTDLGALLSARATDAIDRLAVPADLLTTVHAAHRRHRRTRIAGSALGVAVVLSGAGVGTALESHRGSDNSALEITGPPARPFAYHNARFGFSDEIPGQLEAAKPPTDGDGLSWHSADGKASLTLSAVNNNNHLTPYKDENELYQRYERYAGGSTSADPHSGVVIARPTPSTSTIYQRDVVMSNVIYSLVWIYPTAQARIYAPMVSSTVAHFKAGPDRAA